MESTRQGEENHLEKNPRAGDESGTAVIATNRADGTKSEEGGGVLLMAFVSRGSK